jgi:type IV pilus assembly protein PilN
MIGLGAAVAVLAFSLIYLISAIMTSRDRAADIRERKTKLEAQLNTLTAEQTKLEATLRRPENAEVLERNLMLNSLIDRKSISWTRIFSDLEKVMPYNVRLIYIRLPQISSTNEVTLDMVVGAQTPEPLQDLLQKLVASPLFGPATVTTYLPPSQNETLYRYRVNVNYAQKL